MMPTLIICFIIIIAIIILMNCHLKLFFSFEHTQTENEFDILIKYLFIKKRINPKRSEDKEKKEEDEKPDKGIKYYKKIYKLIKKDALKLISYLLKKAVVFEKINIKTNFGYSNAATTGIMTGVQNAFAYNIMAFFHNNFHVRNWDISVNPDFDNERFDMYFDCIVKMKTVHIISVGIKGLKILRRIKKHDKTERKK